MTRRPWPLLKGFAKPTQTLCKPSNATTKRAAPAVLRREEYWSILAGATGQVYGSGPIWPFADNWKRSLDSTGAVQMAWVKALFEPRAWFDLAPDQQHKLVVAGYGTFDGG